MKSFRFLLILLPKTQLEEKNISFQLRPSSSENDNNDDDDDADYEHTGGGVERKDSGPY